MTARQHDERQLWVARHPGRLPDQLRLLRREWGGPDVFLSDELLEAFAVILPGHMHPKDERAAAYWQALKELSHRPDVDLSGVLNVLMTAALAAFTKGSRQRRLTASRSEDALHARTRNALQSALALARRCHANEVEPLVDPLGEQLRAYGIGDEFNEAIARLEDGIEAFASWLDHNSPVRRECEALALLDRIDAGFFGPRGFTVPTVSHRRGSPSKPWVEREAPALLRRLNVPAALVDDLLYPLRTRR
jgi:hypothetical protein